MRSTFLLLCAIGLLGFAGAAQAQYTTPPSKPCELGGKTFSPGALICVAPRRAQVCNAGVWTDTKGNVGRWTVTNTCAGFLAPK